MTIVADVIIGFGLFFIVVSTIALLIMPDLYTRAHAVAKSETLGLMLVFSLIANPTAVHALVRAASRSGALPWTVIDQELAEEELGIGEGSR